jgi:ATP-dependent DNA ligase
MMATGRSRSFSTAFSMNSGLIVFEHACKLGCEGIVSKRRGSRYARGRSSNWLKVKSPDAPAVQRERQEHWGG